MKKLGLGIAALALILGAYFFGTVNASKTISIPEAEWTHGSEAAKAWREFLVSAEAAGARAFAASKSEREKREAITYLPQLASAALEMKLSKGSASHPEFTDWMQDYRKFLGDTPDAIYHTASLSSEYDYEITGNRRDAKYLGFVLYGRQINGWNKIAGSLSNATLNFDDTGNFRIIVSAAKPSDTNADWMELGDNVHTIMVRQYYHGRDGKTEAEFTIRNLQEVDAQSLTDAEIAARLRDAASFFTDTVDGAIALSDMFVGSPNDIEPPASYNSDFGGIFYPTDDNEYHGGWFKLEEDEALIVEGPVPDAPYWGVSLQNRWMQSIAPRGAPTALNDRQITNRNGYYRVVVAHKKPPSDDWLDTTGLREGLLSVRYQQSQNSERPTLKLVKFDEL